MAEGILVQAPRAAGVRPLYGSRERILVFGPGVYWNVNLRALHDAFFGSPDPAGRVRVIIEPGAEIVSIDPGLHAMRTGAWPLSA